MKEFGFSPPQGAVVSSVPSWCASACGPNNCYQDCNGAFYLQVGNTYQLVPPPVGTMVFSLPSGAVATTFNGSSCFTYGGACYQPSYSGGDVSYIILANPTAGS